jgi:hypothetical protein
LIEGLYERMAEFAATEPSPQEIVDKVSTDLAPELMNLGVDERSLQMMGDYLRKNVENIRSLEDFIYGFRHALTFVAYGYPEFIDPKPSLMVMW